MAKPLLLNLIDACLNALPEGDFYWDWGKRVTGLNKKHDNGYSILGEWVSKEDQQAWQRPGLYLFYAHRYIDCNSNKREKRHLVSLFDLNDEGIATLLHAATYPKSDWAVHCWQFIDRWLFDHHHDLAKFKREPEQIEDDDAELELTEPSLTANSAIALAAQPTNSTTNKQATPNDNTGKTPIRELIIRFAIEAQFDRRDRSVPLSQVDISAVPQKQFPWGIEKLFDVYRWELARELGIHWSLLPEVQPELDEWLLFHFLAQTDD